MIASWRSLASGLISCLCRREYAIQLQEREREAAYISGPEREGMVMSAANFISLSFLKSEKLGDRYYSSPWNPKMMIKVWSSPQLLAFWKFPWGYNIV